MNNFRNGTIFFLLLLLLRHVICEITLIYGATPDSYHLDCIVNEDDPAIYLNNPSTRNLITKQSEFDNAILLEDFEGFNNKTYQHWKIHQYPEKDNNRLKFVKDYRWELFETRRDYPLFNNPASFSIKLSSAVIVKFNINGEIVVDETTNHTENICFERSLHEKWLRLQVYQYNQTGIIATSNNERCYCQSTGVYRLKNQVSDAYKDEKYNYLWTNRSRATYNISIDDFSNNTSRICIIFFTTMCVNCSLFVELRDGLVNDLILDQYFNVDEEYAWETKKFCTNSKLPLKLSVIFITSGNTSSKRNFWAIDDIRLTYDGKRILKYQNQSDIRSYNCESIDTKINSVSILQTNKFCNEIIEKYCENYMNCTACYRRNNQTECCKVSKIIGLTGDAGESSPQLSTTTTISTTTTRTTGENSNVTTDITTTTIKSTETISTTVISTTTSNETINNHSSEFNTNYLYFLLLLIPIVGVVVYLCIKKKSQSPEVNPPENERLTTPDWLYNEPEYKE